MRASTNDGASASNGFPQSNAPQLLEQTPLFRYDDHTRGYIDGTVWRLGSQGRPQAIVTTELHPRYGGSPRVVYDLLSLTETPFQMAANDGVTWVSRGRFAPISPLDDAPAPAQAAARRLFQLKQQAERFTATQWVEGQQIELRRLPQPIDRYQPSNMPASDAAMFLLCNGRNPALFVVIEVDQGHWCYTFGRLSLPSVLTLSLDGKQVWRGAANTYPENGSYSASNTAANIPGVDPPLPER